EPGRALVMRCWQLIAPSGPLTPNEQCTSSVIRFHVVSMTAPATPWPLYVRTAVTVTRSSIAGRGGLTEAVSEYPSLAVADGLGEGGDTGAAGVDGELVVAAL